MKSSVFASAAQLWVPLLRREDTPTEHTQFLFLSSKLSSAKDILSPNFRWLNRRPLHTVSTWKYFNYVCTI